jgi:hypothetical protein
MDKVERKKQITDLYTKGKISDAHLKILEDSISEYYNESETRSTSDSASNTPTKKSPI